ncbi:siderophore-interacting protein [Brevibacterium luteolum]|uniref:Siderophore-interacting protein n=1 Tax=Brevibacterium luteolum TaxID=199591 RepID=A0A849AVW7_9MICO|nr:siderophore-interacting protein [Brevibacterium luteolum]MBM7528997.1 NADPH-dependent ferric siderophore reductase [Brevibacterium luteolum]NNG80201.1 siderophore-interacting protein [Brevibacterium luteolum]
MAPAKKRTLRHGTVTSRRGLSDELIRLTVTSSDLIGLDVPYTDHYIKLLFPPAGAEYAWPDDAAEVLEDRTRPDAPVTRTYTLRRVDTETGEAEIDFVIHGEEGLAGPWARDAEPGDRFAFFGPGGAWAPPAGVHIVLAGDESAAPAIAAALDALPAGTSATAFIEIAHQRARFEMPEPEDATLQWVARDGATPGTALAAAVRDFTPPAGEVAYFIHGVAEMIKDLRRFLFVERGVEKSAASISGYWRLGMTEDEWQSSKREFVAEMEASEQAATGS